MNCISSATDPISEKYLVVRRDDDYFTWFIAAWNTHFFWSLEALAVIADSCWDIVWWDC
jgi:hypothetical protein